MDKLFMYAADATGTSGLTAGLEELGRNLQSDVKGIIPTAVAVLGVNPLIAIEIITTIAINNPT